MKLVRTDVLFVRPFDRETAARDSFEIFRIGQFTHPTSVNQRCYIKNAFFTIVQFDVNPLIFQWLNFYRCRSDQRQLYQDRSVSVAAAEVVRDRFAHPDIVIRNTAM